MTARGLWLTIASRFISRLHNLPLKRTPPAAISRARGISACNRDFELDLLR